ncbi:MAG TPA: ECF transporter S component [Firmicutes bacterium]|nr:ECF transporter S component [Bacillota bacterium]
MLNRFNLHRLVLTALFAALVAIATMVINIPMAATQGFINVGDTVIFLSALLMGPKVGLMAGGLGSALADLLLGYSHWAPWTLVIKGVEGLVAGVLGHGVYRQEERVSGRVVISLVISALWMVVGYYVAGGIMVGFDVALASVPGNLVQGLGSAALAWPLLQAFAKMKL